MKSKPKNQKFSKAIETHCPNFPYLLEIETNCQTPQGTLIPKSRISSSFIRNFNFFATTMSNLEGEKFDKESFSEIEDEGMWNIIFWYFNTYFEVYNDKNGIKSNFWIY